MLQGLFYISLFLITILGILILRPTPIEPLIRKPTPAEVVTRNEVTRDMALFLEKTPAILAHPPHLIASHSAKRAESPVPGPGNPVDLSFKGASLHFQNRDDYYSWIYENAARDAEGFLRSLDATIDPEQKLEILERTGEVELSENAKTLIKEMLLSGASAQLKIGDAGHEQLAEKYLSLYLERESDPALGKKKVDEILHPNSTRHP
ncbi:MAG: hypothetical protein EBX52_03515 [Proteobacteria bacterium]|nr:hypothetical protein [Pseudomonadota bacterium]